MNDFRSRPPRVPERRMYPQKPPAEPALPAVGRWVLGIQACREAIRVHGTAIHRICIERRRDPAPQLEGLSRMARDRGVKIEELDRSHLDRIAAGALHQGVAADVPPLDVLSIDDLIASLDRAEGQAPPFFIALDELTDPHNFGAIVRSAVALGVDGIVWPEDKSAPLSMAMERASAGAVEHAKLYRVTSLPRALTELGEKGVAVVGLEAEADARLDAVDLRGPICIVVGSEGKGLRKSTKSACTWMAKLPMGGPIASLNASVAAGIALYEAVRQRQS